ncbi:MAG TPA: hypothetical protein DDZ96_12590 [Porphyromonadaceae bacterium]|nr:hypothetical protein [Porphyromonadaceae bacterium]HBX21741.1 hypothetical protein [Porphyromonadaceae bacterium]HCM19747.1 hypothetical protein [Porphyromonadaceae bacterium]
MQADDIKNISIKNYLNKQGIYPAKEYSGYGMYRSPLRNERTPSFKVDYNRNLWYDFGVGEGGSIIDLVMKIKQCNFIQAKVHLSNISFMHNHQETYPFSFHRNPVLNNDKANGITLIKVKSLEHPNLLEYLQSRKIDLTTAREHCREIHYQTGGRDYYAIGFANNAGAYALRNSRFKGCLAPNDITTIEKGTETIILLEGFMDYLSLLTMQPQEASVSAVVLNSVNNMEKALRFLSGHSSVKLYLDHDDTGRSTAIKLHNLGLPVTNCAEFYAGYKDLNDFLCGKKQLPFQQIIPKSKRIRL